MKYDFAALRFTEDENLCGNVYWYLTEISLKEGEAALAPVGAHGRLQLGRVERTLSADGANAPYDLRLIKRVAARAGERRLCVGRLTCFELGGVKYDRKHYTRFCRVLVTEFCGVPNGEERAALDAYGVTETVAPAALRGPSASGCLLIAGEGALACGEEILRKARMGTGAFANVLR